MKVWEKYPFKVWKQDGKVFLEKEYSSIFMMEPYQFSELVILLTKIEDDIRGWRKLDEEEVKA